MLKGFRHVATHSYDDFVPELAKPAALAAGRVLGRLKPQVLMFIEKFDAKSESDIKSKIQKFCPRV